MKTIYLTLLVAGLSLTANAQYRLDIGFKTGASNYLGDIGGGSGNRHDFVNDMKLSETKMSAGAFARYRIGRSISLAFSYNYGRIAGDDKLSSNPSRKERNLSFRNDIHELNLECQYFFYSINDLFHTYRFRNNFRTYFGLGLAGFYHNPQAYYEGTWIDLRPLKTEGEITPYSKFCLALPLSAGFYFTFNRAFRIGWEIGWRKTFTDYLDDVSGRYPSQSSLQSPTAASLSNRTGELNLPERTRLNYAPGSKRGDSSHDDAYIFTTINFSYVIKGSSRNWNQHKFSPDYRHSQHRYKKHFRARF